jgi:UDP-N-acetylmuramate: L-alanyl-gamma-D-glutamyl-meso-diaminopimelate ligase
LSDNLFYKSISSFSGAKNRLELFYEINSESKIYRDFAHSPSKVKASVSALKDLFPKNYLIACLELYTFSSLTLDFLVHYKRTFEKADLVWIFYSKKELIKRGMCSFSNDDVQNKIDHKDVLIFNDKNDLKEKISKIKWVKTNLLLMSSGNFQEINFKQIIHSLK